MEPTAVAVAGGETEPNGEPTALRVISPHPSDVHSTTALMQTSQPLDSGARMARTATSCAMSAPERPAHSAGRAAQKKRERGSEGVIDPALALFGPLRAGSLTPTCLVSVVLEEAARMRVQIVTRCMLNSEPRSCLVPRRPMT